MLRTGMSLIDLDATFWGSIQDRLNEGGVASYMLVLSQEGTPPTIAKS